MQQWWTLAELNSWEPDEKDYRSTVDALEMDEEVTEHARVWSMGALPTAAINPAQLADDPDDFDGEDKIESIRRSIRAGAALPHVVTLHWPEDGDTPFWLIEGRHRYNAHVREDSPEILAFTAHVHCGCGAPEAPG